LIECQFQPRDNNDGGKENGAGRCPPTGGGGGGEKFPQPQQRRDWGGPRPKDRGCWGGKNPGGGGSGWDGLSLGRGGHSSGGGRGEGGSKGGTGGGPASHGTGAFFLLTTRRFPDLSRLIFYSRGWGGGRFPRLLCGGGGGTPATLFSWLRLLGGHREKGTSGNQGCFFLLIFSRGTARPGGPGKAGAGGPIWLEGPTGGGNRRIKREKPRFSRLGRGGGRNFRKGQLRGARGIAGAGKVLHGGTPTKPFAPEGGGDKPTGPGSPKRWFQKQVFTRSGGTPEKKALLVPSVRGPNKKPENPGLPQFPGRGLAGQGFPGYAAHRSPLDYGGHGGSRGRRTKTPPRQAQLGGGEVTRDRTQRSGTGGAGGGKTGANPGFLVGRENGGKKQ